MPGGGGNYRPSAAFSSPTEGWLEGPVQVSAEPRPARLNAWPAAVRAPLTAAVTAPGQRRRARSTPPRSRSGQEGGVAALRARRGLGARVPALLERRGLQAAAARRRLARAGPRARGRRPRRDVDVARGDRAVGARPGHADRLRGQPDGRRLPAGRPVARLRGRQGGRAAALRQDLDAGAAARRASPPRTSPASRSRARRRSSPPAATCWSTTATGWRVDAEARALFARRRRAALRRRRRPARRRRRRRRDRTS